ncbi:unnamed protein product [Paramecium octaurelia]|uniref:Uncharacterized protein n=1 Tax=Paramecium octaurelia TaxID=43137 RepID=A0A8S1Y803_PAROT|nr:unnamed protein product [Paramecium octaurelia]
MLIERILCRQSCQISQSNQRYLYCNLKQNKYQTFNKQKFENISSNQIKLQLGEKITYQIILKVVQKPQVINWWLRSWK